MPTGNPPTVSPPTSFPRRRESSSHQSGFTLLAVLFLVAALGIGLAALGTLWDTASRREKETQLLFVGDQYRRAIAAYYQASPGGQKRYPPTLQDLVKDNRFPQTKRHLRRLYPDPLTGKPDWGLVMKEGGIAGIHSLSPQEPLKKAHFTQPNQAFEGAKSYTDWQFIAQPDPTPPN
ncbi:MAG: type II secretion system protein [Pseudomonadota bacterium]